MMQASEVPSAVTQGFAAFSAVVRKLAAACRWLAAAGLLFFTAAWSAGAQGIDVTQRLDGFDAYMARILKDWNAPGAGVGIVLNDKLVFARGYGFRDYEKNLPFTAATVVPIASNTKLFTAIAAGMLVEEGKLTWDRPVRESVPAIRFNNDQLSNTVTLRDMLSHRTGITPPDSNLYQSGFTRKEFFEQLTRLQPQDPVRQTFRRNDLMYAAVGYLIELQSGRTWEQFIKENILGPLQMSSTRYTIAEMLERPEFGVGFTEKRESFELCRIPYSEDSAGVAPAGGIVSNIEDMSHWLLALMNQGNYHGKQVLPPEVLKATLQPAIVLPATALKTVGLPENLNLAYGTGRWIASYRGHPIAFQGGDTPGFHTQVSLMPQDHIGVIVFEIGDHSEPLADIVTYNVYERLLGINQTPWNDRLLAIRLKKKAGVEARIGGGDERVPQTKP